MKKRLVLSVVFLIPLVYVSMGEMAGFPLPGFLSGLKNAITYSMTQMLLTFAIAYINRNYFENGFKALFKRSPTMDSLIAIGSSAAIIYGIYAIIKTGQAFAVGDFELAGKYNMDLYFESAGTILTLITVGKYLESLSKGKTGEAISRLLNLAPKTAFVERNGIISEIPLEDVAVGDIISVKSGSSVPVDGIITEGNAAVDESAITGESIPVEKKAGDNVTGATISKSGYFKMKATRVGEDTTLAGIIKLVEEAGSGKVPIAKLADKVSAVFVPAVIIIAAAAAAVWLLSGADPEFALSIGISVLVISCPCALGLATPVAIMVGTGKGAENGILFKNSQSLETAHKTDTVVLDKTGTVTEGKPSVSTVYPYGETDVSKVLFFAASVEVFSEHPLAKAVVEKAEKLSSELMKASAFTQVAGGIKGMAGGYSVSAGNSVMMDNEGVEISPMRHTASEISGRGETPLYVALNKELIGIIAIADAVKSTSAEAADKMRKMGLEVILLTGDNKRTARSVAERVKIDNVIAEVLPAEKENIVRSLREKGKIVAMVGDGINDSPALAAADTGIAIGGGTDIAVESADIVLIKNDLNDAVTAFRLSAAVIRNIKQNLFWAFFYNAIGIPLAAGVFYSSLGWKLSPVFAAAAMSLSSLFVVGNALRLRLFNPGKYDKKGGHNMEKEILIEGMTCGHCKARIEKALNGIDGVSASADINSKTAYITLSKEVSDEVLSKAVEDAGYTVLSVK